eukprot:TRINITY_DN14966_c0_g1_i1.p1 TRINITY_DN14966_c0_g1~~TRINITY_DN14966_c0_g1_i1.p1  ORF type:complete len:523 (+),score=55.79 TRINITY_DN14966_c0_g1_i1:46-1614(+)
MIFYDESRWAVCFAYSIRGSVFPKGLAWALPFALLSTALNYLTKYLDLRDEGLLEVLKGYSVALAFLVLFRTQMAYGRLMEGVTLLQQMRISWVNVVSCCFAFCTRDEKRCEEVEAFHYNIVRLVSLLSSVSLHQLSTSETVGKYTIFDVSSIESRKMAWLLNEMHKPEIVMQWVQRLVVDAHRDQIIDVAPPILSRVFQTLDQGWSAFAGAQKLNEVPFPFPFAQMVSLLLQAHTLFTTFVAAIAVESPVGSFGLTFMVCLAYWTLNYIAMEIEYPFGDDPNDIKLDSAQNELNERICIFLHNDTMKVPTFAGPSRDKSSCGDDKKTSPLSHCVSQTDLRATLVYSPAPSAEAARVLSLDTGKQAAAPDCTEQHCTLRAITDDETKRAQRSSIESRRRGSLSSEGKRKGKLKLNRFNRGRRSSSTKVSSPCVPVVREASGQNSVPISCEPRVGTSIATTTSEHCSGQNVVRIALRAVGGEHGRCSASNKRSSDLCSSNERLSETHKSASAARTDTALRILT